MVFRPRTGITFFVYAIAGMHLFAGVRQSNQYYLYKDANFEDFASAFITLIRCSTGGTDPRLPRA